MQGRSFPSTSGLSTASGPVTEHSLWNERPGAGSPRQVWLALGFVLVVFVVLSVTIALRTPAWESNDEPDHVQNIETLVSGHWYGMHAQVKLVRYPGLTVNVSPNNSGLEAHQPPLYYSIMAGWQWLAGQPARNPNPGPTDFYAAHGFFAHHSAADLRFLLWLRLPNVVLGAITVVLTFFTARLLALDQWTPVLAAAIVAFMPRFVFLSAFVTNDNLVNLLTALLTFVALWYLRSPALSRIAVVGAIAGLLVLTKLSALPVVFGVIVFLAFACSGWSKRLVLMATGLLTSVAVSAWYLAQNAYRYGDPLALRATQSYLSKIDGTGIPNYGVIYHVPDPLKYVFVDVPAKFIRSFWYGSDWGEFFHWPWPVGVAFCCVLALCIAGLIGRHVPLMPILALWVIAGASILSVWIVAFQTATYDPRLALGAMPALACLAALGLERWRSLPIRLMLPILELGGTLFAIQTNVLAVHWN